MRLAVAGVVAVLLMAFAMPNGTFARENSHCPSPDQLGKINSKEEVRSQLNKIVASLPGYGKEMEGWQVRRSQPLLGTGVYFNIGVKACGKKVAMRSWFVELHFPKMEPSASASQLQLFIAKNKRGNWFWWYRY